MLGIVLKGEGFDATFCGDGAQAVQAFHDSRPDIILLDLMLPGMDGIDICRAIRQESGVPIVMLTAKAAEVDRILGLELGADDYVTKPFSPRELVLRIKRLLREPDSDGMDKQEVVQFKDLYIDVPGHIVRVKGKQIDLTATEFKLLTLLAQRRGRVQTREQLLQDVWNYDNIIDTRTVDTHVRRLREKLGAAARYVGTVRGVGYRFVEE